VRPFPPAEVIRDKRDGRPLEAPAVESFVRGLVDRSWSDAQVGALAMAVCLRGMSRAETVALTRAMASSGDVIDWSDARLPGPVVDKHSTGGVGDKVSLVLAPLVAACGAVVPMLSGRGLGHTGGTLDKLESLEGYRIRPSRSRLLRTLREAGCAIFGAGPGLAPADRRLYALRDVTATVESVPLITASILSKKLAAGIPALVLDVKVGSGAFCRTLDEAAALADSLVAVATGAGVATRALLTDMHQPLGLSAGLALEVAESVAFLRGDAREPRLLDLTLELGAEMLQLTGLAPNLATGRARCEQALDSGAAAERFERMVEGLGGPPGLCRRRRPALPRAPVQIEVRAAQAGVVSAIDTRGLGWAVVQLGGGRIQPGDRVDPRVGLAALQPLGARVDAGQPLAVVHAADRADARAAGQAVEAAYRIDPSATAEALAAPVVLGRSAGSPTA
jgi:thymidine phosphorylase